MQMQWNGFQCALELRITADLATACDIGLFAIRIAQVTVNGKAPSLLGKKGWMTSYEDQKIQNIPICMTSYWALATLDLGTSSLASL